jgi:hypothetical protein
LIKVDVVKMQKRIVGAVVGEQDDHVYCKVLDYGEQLAGSVQDRKTNS